MADEEDEDYMSDKFLLGTAETAPGLVTDRIAKQYKNEMKHNELNQRNKLKPLRAREAENRQQGLANALDSSNKGFAMLQKMGFKHGMGLGKDGKGDENSIYVCLHNGTFLVTTSAPLFISSSSFSPG